MSEQAYPTREQAERIATDRCPLKDCAACDIAHWCASDIMDPTSASQACGKSMLAMHDALDAKQAEIDRLRAEAESKRLYSAETYYPVSELEKLRTERGMSMRQMAKKCRVSVSTYSRWASGTSYPDVLSLKHAHEAIAGITDPLPGSNVSQAQLDNIHFDSMQDWE